jgi:hypothetical protein
MRTQIAACLFGLLEQLDNGSINNPLAVVPAVIEAETVKHTPK